MKSLIIDDDNKEELDDLLSVLIFEIYAQYPNSHGIFCDNIIFVRRNGFNIVISYVMDDTFYTYNIRDNNIFVDYQNIDRILFKYKELKIINSVGKHVHFLYYIMRDNGIICGYELKNNGYINYYLTKGYTIDYTDKNIETIKGL